MPDIEDLNPNFAPKVAAFRDALTKVGIPTTIVSGYRSPEQQQQLYYNYIHHIGGQGLAAQPWRSFHNYGLATDIQTPNPADYKRMWAMAPQFGISSIGPKDMNHFQMAGTLADDINQYHLAGWRPSTMPAPSQGAIAYTGGPPAGQPPQNLVNRTTSKGSAYGNSFLDSLAQIESNNQNIYSGVDKDYAGQPNSRSQGFFQIDTPTWLQFAAKAGIDTTKFPNARSASPEVQAQVAQLIPMSRFGGRTQKMLGQQFGQLDTNKTVGELAQPYGNQNSQGTTLTSSPVAAGPMDPSAQAHGSTVNPAIPDTAVAAAPAAPQNTGNIVQQAFARPPSTAVDKDGNPVPTQSPVEKAANAIGGLAKAAGMGAQTAAAPVADSTPMLPAPQDSSGAMAQAGQQVLTAAIQAGAKPLSWSSRPYGSGLAGMQVPGMTLNQSGYGYG